MIDEIDAGLAPLFDIRPRAPSEVERMPEFKQETAPGAYYNAPPWTARGPASSTSTCATSTRSPSFGMRTLAYHEAIPGHHFQIALAQEMRDVPFFRRIIPFTAYTEGWALYAEQLAAENGFQPTPSIAWAISRRRSCAPCGSWWTPESITSAGPARRPSNTCA